MQKVSDRKIKIILSISYLAVLVLAASTAYAAGDGGHADSAAQMKDFGWRVFNFVVLVAILVWAIKKANVKGSLAERQANIEKDLKEAQTAKETAEAKLREYSTKLDQATKEIGELHAAIIREGEQEKQRIITEAKKAAEKISLQAFFSAEQEMIKARSALRAEAAQLAVEIATGKLSGAVSKSDHERFVGEYLDKVVQIQ